MNLWLKENEQPFIRDVKRLVRIPSVISEAEPGKPFGKNIQLALEEILHISKELGFRTFIDPDGYYGFAEIGSGEEMIGVLGHIDVVPPGDEEEWEFHPFDPQLKDGKLYGRGTQDDKGPTLAALYAAKLLTDFNFISNKRIRFIFGTDEETLWRCMKEYSKKEEMPGQGFTPDSSFPLVFAEKGLLQFTLTGVNDSGIRIKAGTAFNAVPDVAEYTGERQHEISQQLERLGFPFKTTQTGIRVVGESVHAQVAEQGKNAIVRLALALHEAGVASKAIKFISEVIKEDAHATAIFGNCEDEVSGKLKFNIGKIELDDQKESLSIDMRIPVTADKEDLVGKILSHVEPYELTYEEFDYLRSIYVPLDDPLVKTLLDVYQEVTGDFTSKPISSGGATYARTMDHCVAFGAVLPGKKKVEHQPNEHIVLSDIQQAIRIYAKALYRLAK